MTVSGWWRVDKALNSLKTSKKAYKNSQIKTFAMKTANKRQMICYQLTLEICCSAI